ncbi:MAG TPA: hypothetical protein VIM53_04650 [Candidatus Saccharimonadales bacterium]
MSSPAAKLIKVSLLPEVEPERWQMRFSCSKKSSFDILAARERSSLMSFAAGELPYIFKASAATFVVKDHL